MVYYRFVVLIDLVTKAEEVGDRANVLVGSGGQLPDREIGFRAFTEITQAVLF